MSVPLRGRPPLGGRGAKAGQYPMLGTRRRALCVARIPRFSCVAFAVNVIDWCESLGRHAKSVKHDPKKEQKRLKVAIIVVLCTCVMVSQPFRICRAVVRCDHVSPTWRDGLSGFGGSCPSNCKRLLERVPPFSILGHRLPRRLRCWPATGCPLPNLFCPEALRASTASCGGTMHRAT